jgi:motility quorum-sensing regulator/GCU-specific mRNA interferase toxin
MMLPYLRFGRRRPTYSLARIQEAIQAGRYWITRQAGSDAAALGLDEGDIRGCVLNLKRRDFYKTMPSVKRPGLSQDVYRCRYGDTPIYTKLQMDLRSEAVVISFKRDERA